MCVLQATVTFSHGKFLDKCLAVLSISWLSWWRSSSPYEITLWLSDVTRFPSHSRPCGIVMFVWGSSQRLFGVTFYLLRKMQPFAGCLYYQHVTTAILLCASVGFVEFNGVFSCIIIFVRDLQFFWICFKHLNIFDHDRGKHEPFFSRWFGHRSVSKDRSFFNKSFGLSITTYYEERHARHVRTSRHIMNKVRKGYVRRSRHTMIKVEKDM